MVSKKLFLERHFDYEVKMMKKCFYHINQNGSVKNVVLVSFLVHTRNLYEFFYESGNGKIAHAEHYITEWKVKKRLEGLKRWNIQINNFVSHLSYEREIIPYKPYPAYLLYGHFREVVIDFLERLPEEYKTDIIKDLLENLKQG